MSSEEYDLKKSQGIIGQLYPVLLSKDGKIIDGLHRLKSEKKWRTETLDQIDDEEKLLVARCVSNWHRRAVPRKEKEEWINGLARIYKKQGYSVSDEFPFTNEIKKKIMELTGLSSDIVEVYLLNEFKRKQTRSPESYKPRVPASQVIKTMEKSRGYKPGNLVDRHRQEVKEELEDEIRKQVRADVKEEAKEELRRDPDFIIETAETALEVLPTLPFKAVTLEGYHQPTLTLQQKEKLVEAAQKAQEKREERRTGPDSEKLKEIGRYNRIYTGLLSISALLYRVECPVTGNPAESDLIFKGSGLTIRQALELCDKKLMELRE